MKKRGIASLVAGVALLLLVAAGVWQWNTGEYFEEGREFEAAARQRNSRQRRGSRPRQVSGSPVKVRAATGAERATAAKIIKAQLEAFKKDDYMTAMEYQSEALKSNFGVAVRLREMVVSNYPHFANYASVRFGQALSHEEGRVIQMEAIVTGRRGQSGKAIYYLIRENGRYLIQGVEGGRTSYRGTSSYDPFPARTPYAP